KKDNQDPAEGTTIAIKVRLYTTDIDLLSLYAAGYPVSDMIGNAVTAYANGQPLRLRLDRAVDFDFNRIIRSSDGNRSRTTSDGTQAQLTIRINDPVAAEFCRTAIKSRYRCKFLKMLLRYSLTGVAPVGAYLVSEEKRSACESYFLALEERDTEIRESEAGPPRKMAAERLAEKTIKTPSYSEEKFLLISGAGTEVVKTPLDERAAGSAQTDSLLENKKDFMTVFDTLFDEEED
ncbi:MAG: hypothetical protein ABS879_07180, partial [Eubacteriales bacterium]